MYAQLKALLRDSKIYIEISSKGAKVIITTNSDTTSWDRTSETKVDGQFSSTADLLAHPLHILASFKVCYRRHKRIDTVMSNASFTPLVLSSRDGWEPSATVAVQKIGQSHS